MLFDSVPGHHVFKHLQTSRFAVSFRFIPIPKKVHRACLKGGSARLEVLCRSETGPCLLQTATKKPATVGKGIALLSALRGLPGAREGSSALYFPCYLQVKGDARRPQVSGPRPTPGSTTGR